MKIEYLTDINPSHPNEGIFRIFHFNFTEAGLFQEILARLSEGSIRSFHLNSLSFVTSVNNCRLVFKVGAKNEGILALPGGTFECILTRETYENMRSLVEPFCNENDASGFEWLYDTGDDIDLLFSRNGEW
jgi:hypothetical protein